MAVVDHVVGGASQRLGLVLRRLAWHLKGWSGGLLKVREKWEIGAFLFSSIPLTHPDIYNHVVAHTRMLGSLAFPGALPTKLDVYRGLRQLIGDAWVH